MNPLRSSSSMNDESAMSDSFSDIAVGYFAIDRDCRNGSNAQLLGPAEDPSVNHVAHDDFGRRTRLLPHYVNYLMAERASRAEHFDFPFRSHCAHSCLERWGA